MVNYIKNIYILEKVDKIIKINIILENCLKLYKVRRLGFT